ncbi:sortase [Leifsonia sp. Root227]|uniref:SURF1 family cytochrome oxidase biogenesis protein n=1 Tax=Leifsonia sp. Root227 TaxID=1736496 RepID=UPI0007010CC3|nr:SURF1 family protein [Leifsonia sp. Root227]KRC51117.1 sortase [Leifsonia sp. Root227]
MSGSGAGRDTATEAGRDNGSWRFAFSRRWLGYLAFAVAFAIACGCLSAWQLARSKEAAAANALISDNFYSKPVPLTDELSDLTAYQPGQEWTRVQVTGTYEKDQELLVRNRPFNGSPGFEVLTPLRTADGALFIVDRGWVPTGNTTDAPDHVPAAPSGTVTVVARLKASEPSIPGRTAIGRQVGTIQLSVVKSKLDTDDVYTGAYGLLDSQKPSPASTPTPTVTDPPTQDEGLHWSYMIQWIIFALIGFFGLGYALLTEYRKRNEHTPEEQAKAAERQRKRALKRTDSDVEDELIDAAR